MPPDGCLTTGAVNFEPPGCPTAEGLKHSNPLDWTGNEGLHQLRQSGPRCLRRATSNPQRQHSLVGDPSRERIRSVRSYPGTGIVPPIFLWSETLAKPNNTATITTNGTEKEILHHSPGHCRQTVNRNVKLRTGYYRHRSRIRTRPAQAKSIRLRKAFRASSRAFRRQPVCPFRSKPRSGNRTGGSVSSCSSSSASSTARNRSSVRSQDSPSPGWGGSP